MTGIKKKRVGEKTSAVYPAAQFVPADVSRMKDRNLFASILLGLACVSPSLFADALPLPPTDGRFTSSHFSGSANCGECHNRLRDAQGNDVSIEKDWKITMMANSARDPLWQAKVASELRRNPQLERELNAVCTRCHAPMANVEAELAWRDLRLFEHGTIDVDHPDYDAAMDGVSCTLCHQIQDDGTLGTEAGDSGNFSIDPWRRLAYGPKENPRINPMRRNTGFTPTYGAHLSDSAVCASCHDLKTSFVDAEGQLVDLQDLHGGFPEQMVYSEWENSAYADGGALQASCQDCHMPETDGVKLARRPRWLPAEDDFSRHTFLGANTVMLDILDTNSDELGATNASFAPAIEASRANLAGAAQLRVTRQAIVDGKLKVWLDVVNRTGHKLPSGYPSRRAYLHYLVRDAAGNTVFESGRMRDDGSIVGVNADNQPGSYEPHHRVISRSGQVQVYESVMRDTDGAVTHTLLEAAGYAKDNRLTPAGFDKAKVPQAVGVYGRAANDSDFNNGIDRIIYVAALPPGGAGDRYRVEVELRYQPVAFDYLTDLFEDVDEPAVARFKRMYEQSSLRAETIAHLQFDVVR